MFVSGKWLTLSYMNDELIVMVDGKAVIHPDNIDFKISMITASIGGLCRDTIKNLHEYNMEFTKNNEVTRNEIQ